MTHRLFSITSNLRVNYYVHSAKLIIMFTVVNVCIFNI